MKLTGWYRIGIALSLLWFLFTIGFTIYQYNNPTEYIFPRLVSLKSDWIPDKNPDTPQNTITAREFLKLDDVVFDKPVIHYGNIFLYMIVPVFVGWILVFTIVWTIKWIVRGFKSHPSKP